jgi:hypothetical protein
MSLPVDPYSALIQSLEFKELGKGRASQKFGSPLKN